MLASTIALLAGTLLGGCGDEDSTEGTTEGTTDLTTAASSPASTVTASTDAPDDAGLALAAQLHAQHLIDGDVDAAYDRLAASCRASVGRSEYASQYRMAVGVFAGMMGFELQDASTGDVVAELDGDGDGGSATVELLDPDGAVANAEPEPWVYEDGRWANASCPTPAG
jgi:hypothetical protein